MPEHRKRNSCSIFHSPALASSPAFADLAINNLKLQCIESLEELHGQSPNILMLDKQLYQSETFYNWAQLQISMKKDVFIIASGIEIAEADLWVPDEWPYLATLKALQQAYKFTLLDSRNQHMAVALSKHHQQLRDLSNVGIALSAETNLDELLDRILLEGRKLANCDAASLFLIDETDADKQQLIFKLTQNASMDFPFAEQKFPLNESSLVGYSCLHGKELIFDNVHQIPESAPYHFNPEFDEAVGYRTVSMLVLPMKNRDQKIIGALEFINRKSDPDIMLVEPELAEKFSIPFDKQTTEFLKALASQAAVSIEKSLLVKSINDLFEGFVSASVTAIEQRDPTTSGHSFRVAELTTQLALMTERSDLSRFKNIQFKEQAIKEIRYASLLHDFGKVGVREHVLLKEKKLPQGRLELIRYRIALQKEKLLSKALAKRLENLKANMSAAEIKQAQNYQIHVQAEINNLDNYLHAIETANEPSMLPEGCFEHLQEILKYPFEGLHKDDQQLLTQKEFLALSVRKGSLTEDERTEIQNHVVHTYNFLQQIPWTDELSNIPVIAGAHHEKLDGSGYPYGMQASQIPLPAKMMTISDIYDALTASDRPYKPAMPNERALSILESEAKQGFLDKDLVNIFIEGQVYQAAKTTPEQTSNAECSHKNHPCSPEFHKH